MGNTIEKLDGDKQRAKPNTPLPKVVTVKVVDEGGTPVPNIPVEFLPKDGGSADPPAADTNPDGTASTHWTLGPELGKQILKVKSSMAENAVRFKAFAVEVVGSEMEKISGDWQVGPIGMPLPEPLVVEVRDAAYEPVQGVTVDFAPKCGTCDPPSIPTDTEGRAQTAWTPDGTVLGLVKTKVTSTDVLNTIRFNAEGYDPAQYWIRKLEGDWQEGPVGTELPISLVVDVVDEGGSIVPNIPVEFDPDEGEADPPAGTTNPEGKASTRFTLGPDTGRQKVTVTSPATGNSTTFIEKAK